MITIGIDYSLTTPAICVHKGSKIEWKNCTIYYLTSVKKYEGDYLKGKINGRLHLPYTSQTERHDQISNWALRVIPNTNNNIFIEGYSYGSKGLVFNLAENMGILKIFAAAIALYFPLSAQGTANTSRKLEWFAIITKC